jgi:hypothetical protein
MKLSAIVATFILLFHEPATVQADRLVRFLFDDGKDDPNSGNCNAWDNILIDGIITLSGYNFTYARQLRSISSATRGLQYYPPKCKKNCAGFADGKCKATDCVGYRRVLAETNNDPRELGSGKSFSCDTQVEYINTELDKLVNNSLVSSSCKKLLSAHRTWDCYDDVIFGVVERMVLWQVSPTRTIAYSNYSGQSICKNTRVDFEPITNTCVDLLFSTVTGPNNFYKDSNRDDNDDDKPVATQTVFGSGDGEYESGVVFPFLGAYTIKSVPDGFPEKALTIQFNVVTGPVEAVRLWNTTTKTVIDPNFTGGTLCRNRSFNLEVVLGSCATKFRATLTGPSGYSRSTTDSSRPFSMFGDSYGIFNGRSLWTAGVYNFTIYPDQIMSSEAKSILFNVTNC